MIVSSKTRITTFESNIHLSLFQCSSTVFIGMQHIGGNSDLQALHQAGQLQGLLDNASSRHE